MARTRLDQRLVSDGLAPSREIAQRLIRAGKVRVDGHVVAKPGLATKDDASLEVENEGETWVSRGALKLLEALDQWPIDPSGRVGADLGASTGGFTDVLLRRGARLVHAVDVGHGQLAWSLREDDRVLVREKCNARYLESGDLAPPPDLVVIDVSFISLEKILPAAVRVAGSSLQDIVSLIKPQFEAGREQVGRGGVVRDPEVHAAVCERVRTFGESELGLQCRDIIPSPVKGPKGNIEFLAWWGPAG